VIEDSFLKEKTTRNVSWGLKKDRAIQIKETKSNIFKENRAAGGGGVDGYIRKRYEDKLAPGKKETPCSKKLGYAKAVKQVLRAEARKKLSVEGGKTRRLCRGSKGPDVCLTLVRKKGGG